MQGRSREQTMMGKHYNFGSASKQLDPRLQPMLTLRMTVLELQRLLILRKGRSC